MKLGIPKFIDHHPAFTTSGYAVTNEEPEMFNEILGDIKVPRAACIASGGEVLLSVIFRRATKVVAVDHSYKSLAASYTKMVLFQSLAPKEVLELLKKENYDELKPYFGEARNYIPEAIKNMEPYGFSPYELAQLRREWCGKFVRLPKLSGRSARKVTFVHGDLRDVTKLYGTFDMFYASNTMDHSGRDLKRPTYKDFATLLNPGGLLLYTSQNGGLLPANTPFEHIGKLRGINSSWHHIVARKIA